MKLVIKKRILILALLVSFLYSPCQFVLSSTTVNLSQSIDSVIRYHDSGNYNRQLTTISQSTSDWFLERIKKKTNIGHHKLAVVFDIDETLLSDYAIIKTYLSNYLPAISQLHNGRSFFIKYNKSLKPTAIIPMRKLFNIIKSNHVTIFLITGTQKRYQQHTVTKLTQAGYVGWKEIFLRPNNYSKQSIVTFKSAIRKRITNAGYTIILNVGDQYSDLQGGYAEKTVKLPNPYYFIP